MSEDEDRQRRSMSSVTVLGTAGLNFQTWNDDLKSALGMKKLQRYVERKEDKTAKKPKPVRKEGEAADDYETRMEKWEDEANMVMGILRRSLGDHRSLIKGMTDPLDAYEVITKQYSGETEYDIIDLMQRFAITKPKGDDLLGYLTEMQHLQSTLKSLKLEYNDTMLIGTMLYQLKNYETGHPFRTLYNELSFKFKDKPSEIDMPYFVRFAKNIIREVTLDARDAADHVKLEGDGGSALAVKRGYGRSGIAKFCKFCKSNDHKYEDCTDPKFDPAWKDKHRATEKSKGNDHGGTVGKANVVVANDADDSEIELYEHSAVLALLPQAAAGR
jgi:hypothetical protein